MFQTILKASSEAIRLFCIPHAGAGPSAFRGWVSDLAPEIEAVLVELPGREGRFSDPAYVDMELLVRDFTDAVLPYVDDVQEFAFFGNSMGGLVSFEVLQAIKAQTGQEATHLFVSATGAPQLPCPLPPVASLSDCKLIQEICRRYDGIPAEILADQEFLAAVLGTIRADMRVVESYVRTGIRPLGCSITAFAGERDRTVSIGEVEQWKDQTSAAFSMVLLDEDHLYLQSARKQLVETIRDTLLNANCVR